jgi:hypothetical protein
MVRLLKSRRLQWTGYVAHMAETNTQQNFGGKLPFGRLRRRWKDNIKMMLGKCS